MCWCPRVEARGLLRASVSGSVCAAGVMQPELVPENRVTFNDFIHVKVVGFFVCLLVKLKVT